MPTDPDTILHLDADTSGFTAPMTEAAIETAITAVHLATRDAETASLRRAQAVTRLVDLLDGNQSEAARRLGLHQTTVNKLVARARAASTQERTTP